MDVQFKLATLVDYLKEIDCLSNDFKIKEDKILCGFSPISDTKENTISWYKGDQLSIDEIKASVIICKKEFEMPKQSSVVFIPVNRPRMVFAKVLKRFAEKEVTRKIADTVQIGKNVKIGNDISIGHNVIIADNVVIGDRTIIEGNTTIGERVYIGKDCFINSGVVIGSDGFGYERDDDGDYFKIPHIGGVVIGDKVEIGANTCIDRGTLGNTVIGDNVKISNLVQIAHNVHIGRNNLIAAQSMISGSTKVEENCWVAPGSSIMNGIHIGKNATVGLGAVVTKSVKNGDVVAGVPSRSLKIK